MKKIVFLTLLTLTTLSLTGARAADASAALQQALFEEEANQNLEAAIKAYQLVIQQTEEQRKLAATAVYRLGECYRKLGRTNEAAIQYKRILSDFADQGTLATLSRQNLAGLGVSAQPSTTPSLVTIGPSFEDGEIQRLEKMANESPDLLNATIPDTNETPLSSAASKRAVEGCRIPIEQRCGCEQGKSTAGSRPERAQRDGGTSPQTRGSHQFEKLNVSWIYPSALCC